MWRICWYMVIEYWSVCWSNGDPCVDRYVDAILLLHIFSLIKLVWVIVFVSLVLNLVSYKFHQHLFCVLLFSSQCMCGCSSLISLFGWLNIHLNSFVICLSCLAMSVILKKHSLVQVNVNLPEYLVLSYKSILNLYVCVH